MRKANAKLKVLKRLSMNPTETVPLESIPFASPDIAEELLHKGLVGIERSKNGSIKCIITKRGLATIAAKGKKNTKKLVPKAVGGVRPENERQIMVDEEPEIIGETTEDDIKGSGVNRRLMKYKKQILKLKAYDSKGKDTKAARRRDRAERRR